MFKQVEKTGFSLVEAVIVISVISIFSAVAITSFNCVKRRAISIAAQETIRQIKKECEINYLLNGKDQFTSSNPYNYQIFANGSNSCSGGTVTLTPEDINLYPTYLYNFAERELSYNFKGQTGKSFIECNKLICEDNLFLDSKNKKEKDYEKYKIRAIQKIDYGNSVIVKEKEVELEIPKGSNSCTNLELFFIPLRICFNPLSIELVWNQNVLKLVSKDKVFLSNLS